MQTIRYTDPDFAARLDGLLNRSAFDPSIQPGVAQILADVQTKGDDALVAYARKFDNVDLTPADFAVTEAEMDEARDEISSSLRKAIRLGCRQVKDFAAQRIPKPWSYPPRKGVIAGERFSPLARVGAYVPGGTAPLISTVLHTVSMASVAGVEEIVLVTPPGPDKKIHPAILYAARKAGATEIYKLGGVYAIGALAFGTQTVRKVEKIVGPGNAYVTEAKRQVYGHVALDLVAGPSEILVIADDSASPAFIAADMLSQAEHGSGREQAVLVTTDPTLPEKVEEQLRTQSATLSRSEPIAKVLENGVFLIVVETLEDAAEIAGNYAPEHLEIMSRRPGLLAKRVKAAGAIFLGPWTPEPVGDFVAGPSHVLPTGGAARFFSGLTIDQFYRRTSVMSYRKSALLRELDAIEQFAQAEGLDAHGRSASIRADKETD